MYPEDRVLVGVINRKRDLDRARLDHWYRIPLKQLPRGVNADYVAFFLSRAFKQQNGGIHYFAGVQGIELAYRRDLLPDQPDHPRAGEVYYKVQLGDVMDKTPPVLNPTRRPISFIRTTWDRFVNAQDIAGLYSKADYFVDRIYHALRQRGIYADRFWETEQSTTGFPPQLRVLCEKGTVVASTERTAGDVFLDNEQKDDAILDAIRESIARQGGPVTINIPLEGS